MSMPNCEGNPGNSGTFGSAFLIPATRRKSIQGRCGSSGTMRPRPIFRRRCGEYHWTPELELRLVSNAAGLQPRTSNADEAVWGWAREEVTGNLCLGSQARRCRSVVAQIPGRASIQPERRGPDGAAGSHPCPTARADHDLLTDETQPPSIPSTNANAHPTLALV